MSRLALLSVSDKIGLVNLARALVETHNFEIVSSGGTAKAIAEAGLPVTKVSDYTGSPEILGGRVKTLHPRIHGGILGRPTLSADADDMTVNGIRAFDLVVVNLYPFEQTIARENVSLPEAIEQIDIGGPTLLRAAAKNHAFVTVLCKPGQYEEYLHQMSENSGEVSPQFRQECALQAFWHTATYDQAIAHYFSHVKHVNDADDETTLPPRWTLTGTQRQQLRYGENPHQAATWYQMGSTASGWAAAELVQGKPLSYNNLVDLEAARRIIAEFPTQVPVAAVLKHTNPCGAAQGQSLVEAYQKAFAADSVSAFGGIVALNRAIDGETATALTQTFLECIVAPACTAEAREILAQKTNLRVLLLEDLDSGPDYAPKAIAGGFLVQEVDDIEDDPSHWEIVTDKKPDVDTLEELLFAWRLVKHVKSNAILITQNRTTIGVGAGQMNRVGAVQIALAQAGDQVPGAVLASDGFFPFDDSVRTAAAAGISAIVQPGGSRRDEDSIKAANELGIIMAMTGVRHFLH
ncbi:bifunctional phosphoribosylaminoimidazolecarboxamide formyltransferase/IMP cyclohydrolase [Oscillatoria sp. CS-180]|uniref:bifunctional phosphoribosylaminoimidazolecarboxamide formyltransferase/IMP cyclohydrolase n=1 Tax=Oscillatoria sp. CS-180 TaxID=3021720 RepID=UPI00232E49C5|nr:bifunctional phosphoribosylaminoimidazolecarboxamide formyltransferase/IMP cyclohydrolase [Oscillatoria sp. CS-180]MDB9525957.1 bifunctional phosphoribosylaminoimidazolecarboxamide formyltransferase/IMP cyclohydrolase [Oscillatoria sp. CS-180]